MFMLDSATLSRHKIKMAKSPSHKPPVKATITNNVRAEKPGLHARNLHNSGYDFALLIKQSPTLASYVKPTVLGHESINFTDPKAVKALNQALLKTHYAVDYWDIPALYLCPPIPGRADYIHNLADLINRHARSTEAVRVLDIGTGANIIYPLIGQRSYGWQFVGTDIDQTALNNAQHIIDKNNGLSEMIELRLQAKSSHIFHGVIQPGEKFTLTMCNPPFHTSQLEAQAGTQRKWRNLGKPLQQNIVNAGKHLNFGGHNAELYCEGGEAAFIQRMIMESESYQRQVGWFTTLVSKAANLPKIYKTLKQVNALEVVTLPMAQGQKQSRIIAWRF